MCIRFKDVEMSTGRIPSCKGKIDIYGLLLDVQ